MKALADQDALDPALREDPYAYYAALREQAPVHYEAQLDAHLVSRYADVKAVISKPTSSSGPDSCW